MTAAKSASALWLGVAAVLGATAVGCNTDSNLSALLNGSASSSATLGNASSAPEDPSAGSSRTEDAAADGQESEAESIAASSGESSDEASPSATAQPLAPVSAEQLNQMATSVGTAQRASFSSDELDAINRPAMTIPAQRQADDERIPEHSSAPSMASTLDPPSGDASPDTSGSVVQSTNVPRPGSDGTKLVRTTAYCHKEADSLPYGTLTAAGTQLQFGSTVRSAAADWSVFPMGTRFRIVGLPYTYIVDDYGSALAGTGTIDIYQPTFSQMHRWGARTVPVQIIQWGSYQKSAEILEGRKHVPHADHVRQMLRSIEKKGYKGHRRAGSRA